MLSCGIQTIGGLSKGEAECVACGAPSLVADVPTLHFVLHRCAMCGGFTALPRPDPAMLLGLHDSDDYFAHPYFESRRVATARVEQRADAIVAALRRVAPGLRLQGVRHLDVGCDTGTLLEAFARRHSTLPVGIDVSARAVALAQARGLEAHHTIIERAGDLGRFGLITIVDVIEHVASPISFLRDVRERLEPDGLCYVETPNVRSTVYEVGRALARSTGGRPSWLCGRLFLPEHVQYLTDLGLEALAARSGLRVAARWRRHLAAPDVNVAAVVNAGVQALQLIDRLLGRQILTCVLLARAPRQ